MRKDAGQARRYRAYAQALMRIADRLPDESMRGTARRIAREYEKLATLFGDPESRLAASREALSAYAALVDQWSAFADEVQAPQPSRSRDDCEEERDGRNRDISARK